MCKALRGSTLRDINAAKWNKTYDKKTFCNDARSFKNYRVKQIGQMESFMEKIWITLHIIPKSES